MENVERKKKIKKMEAIIFWGVVLMALLWPLIVPLFIAPFYLGNVQDKLARANWELLYEN